MKRWIQIVLIAIVMVLTANVGILNYQNHKSFERDISLVKRIQNVCYESYKRDFHLKELSTYLYLGLREKISEEFEQRDNRIPQIYKNVVPSVVKFEINTKQKDLYTGGVIYYYAAGIIIDREGYILTNAHVTEKIKQFGVENSRVRFWDGKSVLVKSFVTAENFDVEDSPNSIDLGIVKVDPKRELIPIRFGNKMEYEVGQEVLVIGHPKRNDYSLSTGVVSRIGVFGMGKVLLLQTDAAINPGNSGGPVVGLDGKCYGVASFILSPVHANVGLGFCVSVNVIEKMIPELLEKLRGEEQ